MGIGIYWENFETYLAGVGQIVLLENMSQNLDDSVSHLAGCTSHYQLVEAC